MSFDLRDAGAWHALARSVEDARRFAATDLAGLRRRLGELARRGVVGPEAPHQLRRSLANGRALFEGRYTLVELEELDACELAILLTCDLRAERCEQAIVAILGRSGERTLEVAVHLDPKPRGSGACGHALAHCHVGASLADAPKVRVPFPAVGPVAALDWVLSQVVTDWEPAPWPTGS